MNYKISFNLLTGCIVTLIIGSAGVATANPVVAQHSLEKPLPLQIAQSSVPVGVLGRWRLIRVTAGDPPTYIVPVASTERTATFSGGGVYGMGGCNRFMGEYKIRGNNIGIASLNTDDKDCKEDIRIQELKYITALEGAYRFRRKRTRLYICYAASYDSRQRGRRTGSPNQIFGVLAFASLDGMHIRGEEDNTLPDEAWCE